MVLLRKTTACFAALLLLLLAGCPDFDIDLRIPVFENPLTSLDSLKVPEEVLGTFVMIDPDPSQVDEEVCDGVGLSTLHISAAPSKYPKGFIRILAVSTAREIHVPLTTENFIGFVAKLGDTHYFHIPIINGKKGMRQLRMRDQWKPKQVAGYVLFPLQVNKQDRNITFFADVADVDMIEKVSPQIGWAVEGEDKKEETILIKGATEQIAKGLKQHGDKVFSRDKKVSLTLKRIRAT